MIIPTESGKTGDITVLDSHNSRNDYEERKRVWVEAYGCSASMADSERIRGILVNSGYELASQPNLADLHLIVTCGVKESTEHRMLSRIKYLATAHKPLIIAGCLPKADRKLVERFCPSASLLGPHSLDMTLEVIKNCIQGKKLVSLDDSTANKVYQASG